MHRSEPNVTPSDTAIDGALSSNYEPRALARYYDEWAQTYDHDVRNEQYTGPGFIADYLTSLLQDRAVSATLNYRDDLSILDAGCGTGLVGAALHKRGYRLIDGFDLSHTMVAKARQAGVYRLLISGCDMSKDMSIYRKQRYDIVVCCGVFTIGHVRPSALGQLIPIARPGGLIVASTRESYYEQTSFKRTCEQLQRAGRVIMLDCVMGAPYLATERAHYWAFRVQDGDREASR